MMGKYRDLTGERFGRLTVVAKAQRPPKYANRQFWLVRCDCGNERVLSSGEWNRHARYSCGCYGRELASVRAYKQHLTHGHSSSRLYGIWNAMKQRCNNPNVKEYNFYGGRGIKVCDEWSHDYTSFERWMLDNGYSEEEKRGKCTLDRIDVNGDYCPENCRLATQKQQANNTRKNRLLTYNGSTKTVSEWADFMGMNANTLRSRLSYGWSVERCLTQPIRRW